MKYVMNSPVLTSYGTFRFKKVNLEEAKSFVKSGEFISSIGHKATSELLTLLLETEIPMNRITIEMKPGDQALITKLKIRLEEGKVLSLTELIELYEKGQIEFGILEMIEE